jgi:transposase
LLAELQAQGYLGSYASLWRATASFPVEPRTPSGTSQTGYRWSPNQATWLLLTEENRLVEKHKRARTALLLGSRRAALAATLVQSFQTLVRERKAQDFEPWLQQAESSELVEFRRFAASLRQDYQAVFRGLSEQWSNGQTEGQVNRLKLIKRTMYGRASFDLLKRRFLGCS